MYGVSLGAVRDCSAGISLAYGGAVPSARSVAISLSSGKVIQVATIPAPHGQPQAVRFYATPLPSCTAAVAKVVARDTSGHIVGRSTTFPP